MNSTPANFACGTTKPKNVLPKAVKNGQNHPICLTRHQSPPKAPTTPKTP
ncbi:hypothetical protein AO367_0254 [Moraxella catarrhalis]|nr:hypothetical protein AO367_0254 [Moraxella catarrhalis]